MEATETRLLVKAICYAAAKFKAVPGRSEEDLIAEGLRAAEAILNSESRE